MKKIKIYQLMERYLVMENPQGIFEPTQEGINAFFEQIKSSVQAPYINSAKGSMYPPNELYLTVSLQPRDKWPNGIFENSTYFRMTIDYKGTMEVFSANLSEKSKNPMFAYQRIPVKFRKTKAKNAEDAIAKINKFVSQIKDYYQSIGTPIEESNEMKIAPILNRIKEEGATNDIQQALDAYVDKLNQTAEADNKRQGYTIPSSVFALSPGKRWAKIITTTNGGKGQKSVFAFVDPTNGDIYKPAGWNAPAKGARGNVTDQNPPLRGIDLYR